jgi:predicted glycoside hydrolase/deacetylase ChbG (UPF0249 family)
MYAAKKFLIVNADDFGQSHAVNRGIIEAHEHGIVTSGSLMVRWPGVDEAVALARDHPELAVGLHLDLGEWRLQGSEWVPLYEVVRLDDERAVAAAIGGQLDRFRALLGRDPTHLDSHQHVHQRSPAREIAIEAARVLGIPLRGFGPIRYCGAFYGQTNEGVSLPESIGVGALLEILEGLEYGCTELACHPAAGDDLDTMYRTERIEELRTLCDARVRSAIESLGIEVIAFPGLR